jgi:hypothetical protein
MIHSVIGKRKIIGFDIDTIRVPFLIKDEKVVFSGIEKHVEIQE